MDDATRRREERRRNAEKAEEAALARYGGRRHRPFLNGYEIKKTVAGCTVPDLVREQGGTIEAIEVKYMDFDDGFNHDSIICHVIPRQISARAKNLPKGSKQRVFILCKNRTMPKEALKNIIAENLRGIVERIEIDIEDATGG